MILAAEKIYKPFWFWSVLVVRLIASFLFFFNNLVAFLIFLFLDVLDEQIWSRTSDFKDSKYQILDKYVDIPPCLAMLLSSYNNYYFMPMLFLSVFRLLGVFIFLATRKEKLLVFFPNFFESVWIWAVLLPEVFPKIHFYKTADITILVFLFVLKLIQELIIHFYGAYIFSYFRKRLSPVVSLLDKIFM
jgi:hypothetical protein